MDAEMKDAYHQARRDALEAKMKLSTMEKNYTALETVSRIRAEEAAQAKAAADKKAQEAIHFQRIAKESEKQRIEAIRAVAEKEMKVSECQMLVKTLQDDLVIEKKRSEEFEHRLVESENSFPEKIAAHMGTEEYGRELDESEVKLLRAFGAKLATKFPAQAAAMVAATDVFCSEYYDSTYPDGLPPVVDTDLLSTPLPNFESFDPSSVNP